MLVADENLTIIQRLRFTVERQTGAIGIRKYIETALNESLSAYSFIGVGVGFGGPVNWQTGQIARSYQIEGWSEYPLAAWLKSLIKAPIFVENDANVAAFGEAMLGAGQGYDSVFYLTVGSGVGGGLVVNRKIFHGAIPGEVEIGHLRLDKKGTTLQSVCSGWGVDERIRAAIQQNPQSNLALLIGNTKQGEARFLKLAIEQGDVLAQKILKETCDTLAWGLSHAVHLFHPQILIVGGGLSLIGESFISEIEKNVPDYLMDIFQPGPVIKLAMLGEAVVPMGAIALAHDRCKG